MTRTTQHFLVLLLTHALAALLNQRTHKGLKPTGTMGKRENPIPLGLQSGIVQSAGQLFLVQRIGVRVLFPEP